MAKINDQVSCVKIVKSKLDPRHKKRIHLFQELFAWESVKNTPKLAIKNIIINITEIDNKIKLFAPKWPIDKINRVDLSILRLAIWEILFSKTKTPTKVVIDEAVEIAKEYGNESSSSFVNAVLGSIIKQTNNDWSKTFAKIIKYQL